MIYLLEPSALLAFYFGEPGGERMRDILNDDQATTQYFLSIPTHRLKQELLPAQ